MIHTQHCSGGSCIENELRTKGENCEKAPRSLLNFPKSDGGIGGWGVGVGFQQLLKPN